MVIGESIVLSRRESKEKGRSVAVREIMKGSKANIILALAKQIEANGFISWDSS